MTAFHFERQGQMLLDVPSLELKPGSCTCVLGANGAGKSLLLEALCGLLPGEGTTQFEWCNGGSRQAVSRGDIRIGAALQRSQLWSYVRVREVVHLVEAVVGASLPHDETIDRIASRFLAYLSAGERQYLKCFLALHTQADLIVLDEPTANLDHALQQRTLSLIQTNTATRIVSLHSFLDAASLSPDCYYVCRGHVFRTELNRSAELLDTVTCDLRDLGKDDRPNGSVLVSKELRCDTTRAFERLNAELIPFVDSNLKDTGHPRVVLQCTVPERYV